MKQKNTLKVGKGLFLTLLITSICLFSLGIILDIVNFIDLGDSTSFSSGWPLYVSVVMDILLCVAFVSASATMLLWNPEDRGRTILLAAGLYVIICGIVSAISGFMLSIHYYKVTYAISSIIAFLQIGIGSMALILRNRRCVASMIISAVSFGVFAISNLMSAISYVLAGQALLSIFSFIAIAFDVLMIVALCLMKRESCQDACSCEAASLDK